MTLARDFFDALDQMVNFRRRPVEFDDEQRFDVERIAGMDEFFNGRNRRTVHDFHPARDDSRTDDA